MQTREVVIVSACRTAIGKFQGQFKDVSARELAIHAGKEAIRRSGIDINLIDEIVMGECYPGMQGSLPARQVSMRIGLPVESSAVTVNQNCASGMRALEIACNNVMLGKTDIGLVVGVENMTQAPFMLPKARMGYRMGGIPTEGGAELFDSLIHDALYDALVPGHMGVTADNVAKLCNVSRQECDELAVISHNRACAAIDAGKFKEEIVWDKVKNTSPLNQLMRYHETVSILSKDGTLNVTYVPYVEKRIINFDRAIKDINKIANVLGNTERIETLKEFIESGRKNNFLGERAHGFNVSESGLKKYEDRDCGILRAIQYGMREGSIIRVKRDKHSDIIHPTQKPVRLMERLLALTTKQGDLVLDPFCGSCPVGIACVNMDRDFIGWEIDEEYYNGGLGRYEAAKKDKEVTNG